MTDFPKVLPHAAIEEVAPDVFFVRGQSVMDTVEPPMLFTRSMTVLRDGTDLTLVNTVRLGEDGLAALEALGTPRHIVKLGDNHGRDDAFYADRYGARVWAAEDMPHSRGLVTSDTLDDGDAGPVKGSSLFRFRTSSSVETALLLDRGDGILITCDSLQNMAEPDEFFDEATATRMTEWGFIKPCNIGPVWLTASKVERSDFDRLTELPFDMILPGHGSPITRGAKAAARARIDEVFSA